MPNIIPKSNPKIPELAKCEVLNEAGQAISLFSLWRDRTCIFIFLRHFACIGCRTHAVQIWNERQKYEAGGAKLVFIGNGSPDFIKKFKADLKIEDAPVFTDPSLQSFRAAGFKRGFLVALGVKSIANGVGLIFKTGLGTKVKKDAGDLWQMGGILVIRPDGKVAYHFISEALGDYPPESDLKTIE